MQKPKLKVKKPMNAFFIYRKQMKQKIMNLYKLNKSQDVSRIAGQSWALEPDQVKKYYYKLSMIEQIRKEQEQIQLHEDKVVLKSRRLSDISETSTQSTSTNIVPEANSPLLFADTITNQIHSPVCSLPMEDTFSDVSRDVQLACSPVINLNDTFETGNQSPMLPSWLTM
ncbi:hypothetical protein BC833DRAFT_596045 [Globomyces pollinis-pini]|nr:hypothetical protein BC833DRAFT_596045 [Globomyces pollinis-pini]